MLPAFVYRWLRETSGTGFLRDSKTPNRRTQDGEKRYWLCHDCEQLFGRWENSFANRVFYPYLASSGTELRYAGWMMRFCVSVSWRVTEYYLERGYLSDWEPDQFQRIRVAAGAWRDYLLQNRLRPGEFEQHILPLDGIERATTPLAPNINRYFMRAVQLDICRGKGSILTLAKLGRFLILGFVHMPDRAQWVGTRVHPTAGAIRPRHYEVPAGLLDYINEKAVSSHKALAGVSERRQRKIDATFRKNLDRFAGSDAFRAMRADVEMFGDAAFGRRDDDEPELPPED